MNRKQLIEFVNNDILPRINEYWKTWQHITPGKEIIKLVCDYRSKQIREGIAHIDDKLTAKVIDGYLYINNDPIKRIAPKNPRVKFDKQAYYIEGKILARQEATYID